MHITPWNLANLISLDAPVGKTCHKSQMHMSDEWTLRARTNESWNLGKKLMRYAQSAYQRQPFKSQSAWSSLHQLYWSYDSLIITIIIISFEQSQDNNNIIWTISGINLQHNMLRLNRQLYHFSTLKHNKRVSLQRLDVRAVLEAHPQNSQRHSQTWPGTWCTAHHIWIRRWPGQCPSRSTWTILHCLPVFMSCNTLI